MATAAGPWIGCRMWPTCSRAGILTKMVNRSCNREARRRRACSSYVRELGTYIVDNAPSIVNYGERYRNGERISTGFVESTINQVVSKRMVKKQQMQWMPEGAHLLLEVRTQVLNEDWEETFRIWYPNFRPEPSATTAAPFAA